MHTGAPLQRVGRPMPYKSSDAASHISLTRIGSRIRAIQSSAARGHTAEYVSKRRCDTVEQRDRGSPERKPARV
jgi:hypothetical protein